MEAQIHRHRDRVWGAETPSQEVIWECFLCLPHRPGWLAALLVILLDLQNELEFQAEEKEKPHKASLFQSSRQSYRFWVVV